MKKIIFLMMVLLALPIGLRADNWIIQAYYGDEISDSMEVVFSRNDAIFDTTVFTDVYYYDDTLTVTAGNYYKVRIKNWYAGAVRPTIWDFSRDMSGLAIRDSLQYLVTGGAGSISYAGIDSVANANPSHFYGPTATGSGADSVKIFCVDSSNSNAIVSGVGLQVLDDGGSLFAGPGETNALGYFTISIDADDTCTAQTKSKAGWAFGTATINGTTEDTVYIYGYDVPNWVFGAADVCRIYDYAVDGGGNLKKDAWIVARKVGSYAKDTAAGTILVDKVIQGPRSDTTGFVYIDIIKSKSLLDRRGKATPYWEFDVYWDNRVQYTIKDSVPDLDSSRLANN